MEIEGVTSFYFFMNKLKIPVTKYFVKDFLLSHPAYPSLASYADLCDKLNVEHVALNISQDQLIKKDFPVIAHIYNEKKTFFVVIESINKEKNIIRYYHPTKKVISESIENFLNKWTKYVFYAVPKEDSGEVNYPKHRSIELLSSVSMPLFVCSVSLLIFFFLYQSKAIFSIQFILLFVLKIIGLFISVNLVTHSIGNSTKLSKMVCTQGKHTSCDDVLNSPAAKLFGIISMSDIGLVYFSGSILILLLSIFLNVQGSIISLLSLISVFSIPYIIFSLYYQSFLIRKWCPFCISIMSILFFECIFFFANIEYFNFSILLNLTSYLVIGFCFITTICLWTVLKSLLLQAQDAKYKYDFLRLKKNPNIFNAKFNEFNPIEMDFSASDIIIGNPDAKITITSVINTRCGPCALAHRKLKQILTEFPEQVKLVIRFTTGKQNEEETLHLIELYRNNDQKVFSNALDYWFENRNYSLLAKKYPVNKIAASTCDLLIKQLEWYNKCQFTTTPTIILENKKIEQEYDIDDIPWLINNLIYTAHETANYI